MNKLKWLIILFPLLLAAHFGCGTTPASSNVDNWVDEGILFNPDDIANAVGISDPSIITLSNGNLRMYINIDKGILGSDLYSAICSNESTWVLEGGVRLASCPVNRPIALPTGGYRLYYDGLEYSSILSAISYDTLVWTAEAGSRLLPGGANDSAVVDLGTPIRLSDGTYRLYYGGANENPAIIPFVILSATSADGLTFTKESGIRLSSSQGRATHPHVFVYNGQYLMYYSTNAKIYKAVSSDGLSWTESGYTGIEGADCFIHQLSNGNWRMFYNLRDNTTGKTCLRTAIWRK